MLGVIAISMFVLVPLSAFARPEGAGAAVAPAVVEFGKAQKTPDAEKLENAEMYLANMNELIGVVIGMVKEGREEKDVIKVDCINAKLTKMKGLFRIAQQADITLREAVAKADKDAGAHEYHKISIAHHKVGLLKIEAEQCIGELAFAVGKTTVEVEVDRDIVPEQDPTEVDLPETPIIRPPAASPYQ